MWMRLCPLCKALLKKRRLADAIRCDCGWECAIRDLVGFHGPASFRDIGLPCRCVAAVHVVRHQI